MEKPSEDPSNRANNTAEEGERVSGPSQTPPSPPPKRASPLPLRSARRSRYDDGKFTDEMLMSEENHGADMRARDGPYPARASRQVSVHMDPEATPQYLPRRLSRMSTTVPPMVRDRLEPTLSHAQTEEKTSLWQARRIDLLLNVAIGLQVVFGSIITALAALAGGKKLAVVISVLGGVETVLGSYLAKNRGSNEPEASKARAKTLGNFLRDVEAFLLDHGHEPGINHDEHVRIFRSRLEEIKNGGEEPSS